MDRDAKINRSHARRAKKAQLTAAKRSARGRGLIAVGALALAALVMIVLLSVSFRMNDEQRVGLVVLEVSITLIAGRFIYLATTRLLVPSWQVERLTYKTTHAYVGNQLSTISTPDDLVGRTWSRRLSLVVLVIWLAVWLAVTGALTALIAMR